MAKKVFAETRMFYYHRRMKIAEGLLWIFGGVLLVSLIVSFFILRNSDIAWIIFLRDVVTHVSSNISAGSLLGVLYTSLFFGLFFVYAPIEIFFVKFLAGDNSFLAILFVYLIGLTVAFTVNYYVGMKLSSLSKKFITPKKFYKIKGKVNKYGGVAIFVFNATPLPSQILAGMLGVFKYNKTRFYIYFFLGQITKAIGLWLGVSYFL